jgi:hypothetical protein
MLTKNKIMELQFPQMLQPINMLQSHRNAIKIVV